MREEYKQITELHQKLKTIYDLVEKYPNNMELGAMVRQYYHREAETSYIYESPDGGKTVYRRKFGDYETPKELVKDENQMDLFPFKI